jgi:putative pyruvate formate lyase activating enzyme
MMVNLQKAGALNINFVTPTHVIAQIIEALVVAQEQGLNLPLVYNCGGYENIDTLKTISGIFDIYMPDIKYSDNNVAAKYSDAADYWEVTQRAVKEMYQQVGDLRVEGIATRGLLVRHLVLPNRLSGSFKALDFLRQLSKYSYVNIMDQYHPCYKAYNFQDLARRIAGEEYEEVLVYAKKMAFAAQGGISYYKMYFSIN